MLLTKQRRGIFDLINCVTNKYHVFNRSTLSETSEGLITFLFYDTIKGQKQRFALKRPSSMIIWLGNLSGKPIIPRVFNHYRSSNYLIILVDKGWSTRGKNVRLAKGIPLCLKLLPFYLIFSFFNWSFIRRCTFLELEVCPLVVSTTVSFLFYVNSVKQVFKIDSAVYK